MQAEAKPKRRKRRPASTVKTMQKVYECLKPLSADERKRVLKAVNMLLEDNTISTTEELKDANS